MSIEILTGKLSKLTSERSSIDRKIQEEINAAAREIRQRYAADRAALTADIFETETAINQMRVEAAAADPMIGKRVMREQNVPLSKYSSRYRTETIYGVVEVHTPETQFPINQRWGIPKIGDKFVRLYKKNGSLSLRFENMNDRWKVAE